MRDMKYLNTSPEYLVKDVNDEIALYKMIHASIRYFIKSIKFKFGWSKGNRYIKGCITLTKTSALNTSRYRTYIIEYGHVLHMVYFNKSIRVT